MEGAFGWGRKMRRAGLLTTAFCAAMVLQPIRGNAGGMNPNNLQLPTKDVILSCSPLRYTIHCSLSLRANPEYSSYCFYVAAHQSYPMKTDYRFGFYNELVSVRVHNGVRVNAQLTDLRTGRHAFCSE
jgi:hypothetical protein